MAKAVVVYKNSDLSFSLIKIAQDADLALYPVDPANCGAIEIPSDHPVFDHPQQYKISNDQLVRKNIVQASTSSPTFAADGTTQVQITFAGLNASTAITVAGQQVTITPTDNILTLTADAPQTFTLQVSDNDQWSNPVTVEAV